jgi:hypothetical protein
MENPKCSANKMGRRDQIRELAALLFQAADLLRDGASGESRDRIKDIQGGVSDAVADLMRAETDEVAARIEQYSLRPLAMQMRRFAGRYRPAFVAADWDVEANANFFCLISQTELPGVEAALSTLGMHPVPRQGSTAVAKGLWLEIARSGLVVLNFLEQGRSGWPRAAYALGIAMVLGRPFAVVTDCPDKLPFDIHTPPLLVHAGAPDSDAGHLADAIGRVCLGVDSADQDEAVLKSAAAYVLARFPPSTAPCRYLAHRLASQAFGPDMEPLKVERAIDLYLSECSKPRVVRVCPTFRPAFPETEPVCFHILAFRLDTWVTEAVRESCGTAMLYERGDTAPALSIIDRMLNGICRSRKVVVDLTPPKPADSAPEDKSLNANVCLELAVAQGLCVTPDSEILLVADQSRWEPTTLFQEIKHLSVEQYTNKLNLARMVTSFLFHRG